MVVQKFFSFHHSSLRNQFDVFLFTVIVVMLSFHSSFAQNKTEAVPQRGEPINIINADELEYSELGGQKTRKLTGNVQLQQKDVTLFCDFANNLLDSNIIIASGHVRI